MKIFYPFELLLLALAIQITLGRRLLRSLRAWRRRREVQAWRDSVQVYRDLSRQNFEPWQGSHAQAILLDPPYGIQPQRRRPAELDDLDRRKQ